jgi:TetR/AcrR family transcriptional repressor of nem operon
LQLLAPVRRELLDQTCRRNNDVLSIDDDRHVCYINNDRNQKVKSDRKHQESLMRVSKEKAAQNRQDILTAAARLFREQGVNATGVDSITKDVSLTHGAVYSQFGSKEAIAAEVIRLAFRGSKHLWQRLAERKGTKKAFPALVAEYLSREHRDAPGQGCVVAALGSEIARQPQSVREAFTKELEEVFKLLSLLMPGDNPARRYEDAIGAFAGMVGALMLARAVSDETLSDRILHTTAKRMIQRTNGRRRARRTKGIR